MDLSFRYSLNNGVFMPGAGFGGGQADPAATVDAVTAAVAQGYRLFDTGAIYGDEPLLGQALKQSGITRDEVFLISKLWVHDYGEESAINAFERSARNLGVDYIDLYLLHWPIPDDFERTITAYQALETLLADGRVKAIGTSNFTAGQLDRLIADTSVVPAVNQIEIHPYFSQASLRKRHQELGILSQAWSPIGGIDVYMPKDPDRKRSVLDDPVIRDIATRHGRTPAQVVLRWHLQNANAFISKSSKPERIAENARIFDFTLSDECMARIDGLDTGIRGGPDPELFRLDDYPPIVGD